MAGFDNDVIYGVNADYSNALSGTGASTNGQLLADGDLWIGATATNAGGTHINKGNITSTTLTIGYSNPNITIDASGTIGQTITGNSGGALPPTAGNWNILTANSTVTFAGAGSTLTQDFSLTNLFLGSNGSTITTGQHNVGMGLTAMQSITSGEENIAIGWAAGNLLNSGIQNTLIGAGSGDLITTSNANTALGAGSLGVLTTGAQNTAIGRFALNDLTTGSNNISIGRNSGVNYSSSESGNILIGNSGVLGESNTMRLGTQGSVGAQVNRSFIAGVQHQLSGIVVPVVAPGAYPYTTLITDQIIMVDTTAARTINLIASPETGTIFVIKDATGTASANNITIVPNAGNIDGAASYVINVNWGSVKIVFSGTQWNIL